MNSKKMIMGGLAIGAAYLLKNKKSRQKFMDQLQSFGNQSGKK
jgi:hypothetical protein